MQSALSNSLKPLGNPTWARRILLYTFVLSIVLISINFNKLKYVVLFTFLAMSADVVWHLIRRPRIPYTPVYLSIALFTVIYGVWMVLSIYYGNHLIYILKDSAGFLVYWVFPIIYIYVVGNQLAATLGRAILLAASVVVAINASAFVAYYVLFDTLNLPNLMAVNAGIASFGFTWELGASNGILRANTKAGHFILLGIALLVVRFSQTKHTRYLMYIGVFIVGALLDGHKALLVAIAILIAMVSPLFVFNLERRPLKLLAPIFLGVSFIFVTFALFVDPGALIERFSDLGSSSFQTRKDQVASLLVEINNRPLFGNGFGASASIIRSDLRPFMYEIDFLAVMMKLGVVGGLTYFLTYIATISWPMLRNATTYHVTMFSLGMAYLFYMGANGGFAMSPISSFFHLLLFMCVSVCVLPEYANQRSPSRRGILLGRSSQRAQSVALGEST